MSCDILGRIIPYPNDRFLDSTKLKEFANGNSLFDENGTVLQKGRNTAGKGELLLKSNFSFPNCFLRTFTADT